MITSSRKPILLLGLCLTLFGNAKAQETPASPSRDYYPVVSVLYGTDREFKNGRLTGKNSSDISFGQAQFTLHLHYFRKGDNDQTWWRPRSASEKSFGLQPLTPLDEKNFNHALRKDTSNETFIYVHGFSTTFEEGINEAAQTAYDLQLPGKPILYSWPSQGRFWAGDYNTDQKTVNHPDSIDHLKTFIPVSYTHLTL